jgi:hypothetical protein
VYAQRLPASLAWIALAAALSPLLVDLAQHWIDEPWALPSAAFLPLWLRCAYTDASPPRPRWDGYAWLALALALEVVAVGGGMPRYGRPAVPLAVLGLARVLGHPTPARALVALWLVPVPWVLQQASQPALEALLGAGVAALGLPLRVDREADALAGAAGVLPVSAADSGLALAGLLAGLGWYAAASSGASLRAAACAALRRAALAPALQAAVWAAAIALLSAGAIAPARSLLAGLPLVVVFAFAFWGRDASAASRSPALDAGREPGGAAP